MGGLTFCSNNYNKNIFQLNRMSRQPLILDELYLGPWVFHKIDYVVFPVGIMLDDEDDRYVLISLGHQDTHAHIIRFEIEGLLNSMKLVNNCS